MGKIKEGFKKAGRKIKAGAKRFGHWFYEEDGWKYVLVAEGGILLGEIVMKAADKRRIDNAYNRGLEDGGTEEAQRICACETYYEGFPGTNEYELYRLDVSKVETGEVANVLRERFNLTDSQIEEILNHCNNNEKNLFFDK